MAIVRLTDVVTTMKEKWTYGDKFFGYTEEFNDNHNTQYPSLLITPPNSSYPSVSVRNGWEIYTFEVYFSDMYNRTQQQNENLEKRWDNLQDLANEWLDRFLIAYQRDVNQTKTVISYLDDDSLVIERQKEVANDQMLQIKMTFNWKIFSRCFTPVSIYPDQVGATSRAVSKLVVWLNADSGATFSIPTKKVSAWADQSNAPGGANSVVQTDSSKQPKRYTYDGANDKTRFEFDGAKKLFESLEPCPLDGDSFTFFVVAKAEPNTGSLTQRVFSYKDTGDSDKIIIGYNTSNRLVAKVWDEDGDSLTVVGSVDDKISLYHIMTVRLVGIELSIQYNDQDWVAASNAGFGSPSYDNDPYTIGAAKDLTADTFLDGNIQEVLLYNTGLSDAETAEVREYLNRKYKIY